MTNGTTLGRNIKKVRESLGLSQKEFAHKIGLNGHAPVSRYEVGHVRPDSEVLERIAALAGQTVAQLEDSQPQSSVGSQIEMFIEFMQQVSKVNFKNWRQSFGDERFRPLMRLWTCLVERVPDEMLGDHDECVFQLVLDGAIPGIGAPDLKQLYDRLKAGEPLESVSDRFDMLRELRACQVKVGRVEKQLDQVLEVLNSLVALVPSKGENA